MDRDTFWLLVDEARSVVEDPADVEELADALTDLLCRRDEDQAVAFARTLNALAARLAGVDDPGEVGDEDRALTGWLVAQGRAALEHAAADPDRLADLAAQGVDGESLFDAPYDAYGRILGDDEGYLEAVLAP